jgi:hypothetical protein
MKWVLILYAITSCGDCNDSGKAWTVQGVTHHPSLEACILDTDLRRAFYVDTAEKRYQFLCVPERTFDSWRSE